MSDSTRFDKVLKKFQDLKQELTKTYGGADAINNVQKAKVEVDLGMPAKKGKTATNEYVDKKKVEKYDTKRQDGVNVDPPLNAKEMGKSEWKETKKAEFLAMNKHGQWSMDKTEAVGKDNSNKNKNKKEKEMDLTPEKESPHDSPTGEPYAGSGKDRMAKATKEEPHEDDPHHEAKEKKIGKDIKSKAEKLLDMHKNEELEKGKNILTTTNGYKIAHLGMHSQGDTTGPAKQHRYSIHDKAGKHLGTMHYEEGGFHGNYHGPEKHFDHVVDAMHTLHNSRINKMDDATTLNGPANQDLARTDEGGAMSGDYLATGVEKKQLPDDAEYQEHIREVKDRP